MSGSINEILPDPISPESEQIINDLIRKKVKNAASLAVNLLHEMENHFGPEAREVMNRMVRERKVYPRDNPGDPKKDLAEFCSTLDKNCVCSHQWNRITEKEDLIAYEYKRCLWADVYRELEEPELGFYYCAGDDPGVRSYNPEMRFARSKTLMEGDPVCDHIFYINSEK